MTKYHKINSLYKRYMDGPNKGRLIWGDYADDNFKQLYNCDWHATEKVDGMNMRLIWDGQELNVKGKTDNAEIPKLLQEFIDKKSVHWEDTMRDIFGDTPATVYGEGYGKNIQNPIGKQYFSDGNSIMVFDVNVKGIWLERSAVVDIALSLNLGPVPYLGIESLLIWEEYVEESLISKLYDGVSEGVVCTPVGGLLDRMGRRIIVKLKHRDYIV